MEVILVQNYSLYDKSKRKRRNVNWLLSATKIKDMSKFGYAPCTFEVGNEMWISKGCEDIWVNEKNIKDKYYPPYLPLKWKKILTKRFYAKDAEEKYGKTKSRNRKN